ncbi:DUF433 domain-containing protein [Cupriavidus sp. AcVe19-6a]|uniref:DUF433 domain-containing protein n=1 Tax=Cupriavidus sp. AcVe19-6a TaxID=2821358 RepID=UPI001AEA25A5|nr:DUF433 domain-containing protein [Cupriavidus sp. AcVe19-6a]MBP0639456.1 DUF433 domain-containing protein [Cupriavidus sp. AcVe19-6a]
MATERAVSVAQVAYLANATDKEINRLVDEHVLPDSLVTRDNGRRMAPFAAPLACFFLSTGPKLTRTTRLWAIEAIIDRVSRSPAAADVLALTCNRLKLDFDWVVRDEDLSVSFDRYLWGACERAEHLMQAEHEIVSDPEILGGAPCFRGTRLPIATVLEALEAGDTLVQWQEGYSFLTQPLIDHAKIYLQTHPRPGRPRRLSDTAVGWKLLDSKVVGAR